MRGDALASGARRAMFPSAGIGEDNILRNVAPEGSREEIAPVTEELKPKKVFRPLNNILLVRRIAFDQTSSIIIQDTMEKEQPAEGHVVAVGKKVSDVFVGDHVVFGKYAGEEFKLNGEILLLMRDEDLKGIVDDERVEVPYTPEINVGGCIVGRS